MDGKWELKAVGGCLLRFVEGKDPSVAIAAAAGRCGRQWGVDDWGWMGGLWVAGCGLCVGNQMILSYLVGMIDVECRGVECRFVEYSEPRAVNEIPTTQYA